MKRLAALVVALASVALAAPPAQASIYSRLLHIYQTTGSIPACKFSSSQLQGVLNSTDAYEAQYFADFTNAIRNALSQRAAGACSARRTQRTGAASQGAPLRLGPVIAATNSSMPTPIVLLAVLGGLFLLGAAGASVYRLRGWDPAWAAAWRHSWSEAEYRLSATWHEFVDWLRGRS